MLPRGWLLDTATLYARVFRRGARLALTNWPVGLMVVAYGALLGLVTRLVAPLGIIGGFVLWFVMMACLSSWLSLVEQVIRSGRVRLGDVPSSFAAYLGELLAVGCAPRQMWSVTFPKSFRPANPLVGGLDVCVGLGTCTGNGNCRHAGNKAKSKKQK